jgi:tetratricopeptide (TPR) repeat protein
VNPLPTRPPLFIGREAELADLRQRLQAGKVVGLSGMPGRGKSTLALEFAHRYQSDFESVYWLPCQSQSLPSIAGDLSRQLGLKFDRDINEIVSELKYECARKRCLLILDNVDDETPGALIPGGEASVLVTTRQPGLRFLRLHPALPIELFTEEQCFELFRQVLGAQEVAAHEVDCRKLFTRIGRLPLAVSVLAGLIKYDLRHTISSVAAKLPADVTELIAEAINALDPQPRELLAAMSACALEGFGLALAAALVPLDEAASLDALHQLSSRSLVEEIDRNLRRYRVHALVREAADGRRFGKQHAEAVNARFRNWEADWWQCEQDLPDFQVALTCALANSGELLTFSADGLAFNGFELNRRTGHLTEALEICEQMSRAAEQREDSYWLQAWLGNQALILKLWGRLEEALALHKKKEALCLELGNKNSLQISYGNQALILRAWGQLEEALALHKKEEALCLELGNKDGLQRSYGNQALILRIWEKPEEALALHKRAEALCLELGDKNSLHISYGNQAAILGDWARLDEALALLKKKETLCLELGNRAHLGYCYYYWGLLARAQGDSKTEQEKLSAALDIFTQLKMPRERDFVAAELGKSRSAGIS